MLSLMTEAGLPAVILKGGDSKEKAQQREA